LDFGSVSHVGFEVSDLCVFLGIRIGARDGHETGNELKSLILAQIERWRHALHMQVERQHGG
jgi:hypothetical protein